MALTKEIAKADVKHSAGNYMINMNCIVKEDGVEVGQHSFSVDWKPGTDVQAECQKLQTKMQEFVDQIKAERNVYNNAQLDAAVSWLNANVNV